MIRLSVRRKVAGATLLCLLLIVLLYPLETTVVPEWKIQVVDESGNPTSHVPLRETWEHSSLEVRTHEEDLSTNEAGYVIFPARTIRASLALRVVRYVLNKLNPHGSTGPTGSIYVLSPYKAVTAEPYYLPNRYLAKQIVAQPSR